MTIRDWPITERPRERLLAYGAKVLSDGELLAVLLGSGNRGGTAVELARQLISTFGSLHDLLNANRDKCLDQRGIGPARYASLQAALELARRHYCEPLRSCPALSSPHATHAFLRAQLRHRPYELFCCLYLDGDHRLLAFEELFRGGLKGAEVPTGELVKTALTHHAAGIILAHNHPTGDEEPSLADRALTRRIRDALSLVDVRVVDHVIVGQTRCVSFADRGLI
jgi:DNA repair protein RadC